MPFGCLQPAGPIGRWVGGWQCGALAYKVSENLDGVGRLFGSVLDEIGVMGIETLDGAPGVPFSSSSWGRTVRPKPPTAGAGDGWGSWWWAIPGGAAGVVLSLLLRRPLLRLPRPPFGRGGGPQENEPRQQLLEL